MGICCGSKAVSIISSLNKKINAPVVKKHKAPPNGTSNNGGGEIVMPNLKEFTYEELMRATNNFRVDLMLGEGGFGEVCKGWIDEATLAPSKASVSIPIAVKRCKSNSAQGVKEWKTEIEYLGKFSHPNLVTLIGYCGEEKELLLVYEYMQKGSLETHLFQKNREPPSWSTRIKIAIDAARGLHFLHTTEDPVIYRDFKAANILLDEKYNAKLSDFGIARLGPPVDRSHVTTQAVGTYGYIAPEYMNTGHLYIRSDVYSFGVVLLELITGLRAFDGNRPAGQTKLVDWYRPMLNDMSKLKMRVDFRIQEHPPKAMNNLAQLISRCIQNDHKKRPHMSEVLLILDKISTIRTDPKGLKASSSHSNSNRQYQTPIRRPTYPSSSIHRRRDGLAVSKA